MTDFAVSLLHGLFGYFLLAVLAFLVIALSMQATNGTFKERIRFALWGTGIVVTLLAYYSLFSDLFAEEKLSVSNSASATRTDTSLPASPPKTESSGTTVYLKNYRHKGDEPIAIRCEQKGAGVECKAAK